MTVRFTAPLSLSAGNDPIAVIAEDLNNDGLVDMGLLWRYAPTLSLKLGTGAGNFATEQTATILDNPATFNENITLAAGDFNGDGFLDLAVGLFQNNFFDPDGVSILLNDQNGGFNPVQVFEVGRGPGAIAIGDVNGDNILDLAVLSQYDNSVSTWLGNGTGGFTFDQSFATPNSPSTIALANFNEDPLPELLVYSNGNATGTIFINTGGTLAPQTTVQGPFQASGLTLGDFNGDTLPDLALVESFGDRLAILLNNGDLGFADPQVLTYSGEFQSQMVTADMDQDGNLDLIATSLNLATYNSEVVLFLGDGTGGFVAQAPTFPLSLYPRALVVADVNQDTRPDLLVHGFGSSAGNIAWYINTLALDIQAVTPTIQDSQVNGPVGNLTLTFNETVQGFDKSDLRLERNGVALSLNAASLTTSDGGRTWVLGNLAALTRPDGSYTLSLRPTGTGIRDRTNNLLSVITSPVTWQRGTLGVLPPTIDFSGGEPGRLILGSNRRDRLTGTPRNDELYGFGGNDRIRGLAGNDAIDGGNGNDVLFGQADNDRLLAGNGDDIVNGGHGNDWIEGGAGNDQLAGVQGQDVLTGGLGRDTLIGGGGADVFRYTSLAERGDLVQDFRSQDMFDLTDLFQANMFGPGTPFVHFTRYVRLVQVGTSTQIRVDLDGMGVRRAFVTLATLLNTQTDQLSNQNFVL